MTRGRPAGPCTHIWPKEYSSLQGRCRRCGQLNGWRYSDSWCDSCLDEALVIVGVHILKSDIIVEPRWNPRTKQMEPTKLRAVERENCQLWKRINGIWSEL